MNILVALGAFFLGLGVAAHPLTGPPRRFTYTQERNYAVGAFTLAGFFFVVAIAVWLFP